jgi:hypothetical protein
LRNLACRDAVVFGRLHCWFGRQSAIGVGQAPALFEQLLFQPQCLRCTPFINERRDIAFSVRLWLTKAVFHALRDLDLVALSAPPKQVEVIPDADLHRVLAPVLLPFSDDLRRIAHQSCEVR